MKLNRKLVILLVLIMVSLTMVQAFAENLDELKKKQEEIKDRMDSTREDLNTKQKEVDQVNEEIRRLDQQVNDATLELMKVTDELEQLNNDIVKTSEELEEAEEKLIMKNDEFYARLRAMYKNGNSGYIELLLSAENIAELLSRNTMIQKITDYDRDLLTFIKEQKDLIQDKKTELEGQRASVETVKSQIESRKSKLERASRDKANFMSRLQDDIEEYKRQEDELLAESEKIKTMIVDKEKEIARKKAEEEARRKAEEARKNAEANRGSAPSGGVFLWPVPSSSRITSYYGMRLHPILGYNRMHTGLDIGAPSGTPIVAVASGTVLHAGWLGSYGNTVMISHGDGITTLYAHSSAVTVSSGQYVNAGDTVALVGSTGNSNGPHLHFEVRKNGDHVNPLPYIK